MAKPKIENVRAEADSHRPAILWTIGDRRFHVWLGKPYGDPEDVVHSNPVAPANPRRNEHRALDRTNKKQSEIWAEVWAIVERDDLLTQAHAAEHAKRHRSKRREQLKLQMSEIERFVIAQFRAGLFSECVSRELKKHFDEASAELASLGGEA